jgi:hypothetical protein
MEANSEKASVLSSNGISLYKLRKASSRVCKTD